MTIREQVDDYVRAARLNRAELAAKVGCTPQSLSRLLVKERSNPSVTPLLLQVLEALGLYLVITTQPPEKLPAPRTWFDEVRPPAQGEEAP